MMKNTVDPMATQSGMLAALLAEQGYTGPEHVVDGKEGLTHCFGPEWKLNVLTDGLGDSWRITQCGMKFFPTEALRTQIKQPLVLTETADKFDILATVAGGGVSGQAGAMRLGISRALVEYNAELRKQLKTEGLLTRDARAKERKKYGMAGARKRFQFSKR
jgi:ribosomal protein S9